MSIFENNIVQIRKYNPVLADKLEIHSFSENVNFEVVATESGDHNLIYNGIPVHDANNPQQEAQMVFDKLKDTSEGSVTIVFGLGLGYLFKRIQLSSSGKIIIFEPDLDILHFTLEVVDFSQEFGETIADKPRVYIVNTRLELMKFLEESYAYKAYLNVCGLSSVNKMYPDEMKKLQEDLPRIC